MLEPLHFFLIIIAICGALFIYSSLQLREQANRIAKRYCDRKNVQFLDGSVGFGTLAVVWEGGKIRLRRVYLFEYSDDRLHRRQGAIIFISGHYHSMLLLDEPSP